MEHVVARLDKPKVYIGTHGLALITKDGLYVDGVCNGDGLMYAQAGVEKCAPAQKLPGTTIFLCHTWSNGYFHWVLEALPRLVLIEKSGYAIKNVDRILVRQKNQTVVESLALFGIESNKIIEAPVNCLLEPDWTFFTDSLENYDFSKNPTSIPIELWIPNELSKRLVQPQIMSSKRSAFYIDRSKALVRKVVNDDAILSRLKSHEIEIIRLEDFSFTDKFSLMASANFLVGPSGAGFANLAFATEGSNALIFYGQGFESDSFFSICAAKDLNHSHLVCERVLSDSSQPIGTINDDIVVDVRKFDECIEQLKQCAQ
jgi:capsular polysaccharide biosynthesis protein